MTASMKRLSLIVYLLLFPVSDFCGRAPAARDFEKLEGHWVENRWNDGDSFHVRIKGHREVIFRLYFVDTPECEAVYLDRIKEQAEYFNISESAALDIGREARVFVRRILQKKFTVHTRWRVARGRSNQLRYYAVIHDSAGRDLCESLVSAGLARIYGVRTPLPDEESSRDYLSRLRALETEAKSERRGAWAKTGNVSGSAL